MGTHLMCSACDEALSDRKLLSALENDTHFLLMWELLLFGGLCVFGFSRYSGAEQIPGSCPISKQTSPQRDFPAGTQPED